MSTTLTDLAQLVDGQLIGDPTLTLTGAATVDTAQRGQITLAENDEFAQQLENSAASAVVVNSTVTSASLPTIVVEDVHAAFAKIVKHFRPLQQTTHSGISDQAYVSPSASIGENVEIHPLAYVGDNAEIGNGTKIYAGAKVLAGCKIGSDVTLFPNAVLYENTLVGNRSIIHAGVVLGAYGFGYSETPEGHKLSSQLGYVEVGEDVEIGSCATVDRGTYGPTVIGDGTKIDNLVQIAHNCQLGKHNLICAQVGIAGSTSTGDYVTMAGQVGVRDHVHIGTKAILCSKAGVSNNVADGDIVLGQPATPVKRQKLQMAAIAKLPEMRKEFKQLQRKMQQLEGLLAQDVPPETNDQAA